jgi:predicted RNase H-like HicB family nuclease
MNSEIIFIVEEADEGGYIARALGHSIFTEGDSYEEVKRNILDAIECHFDAATAPKIVRIHFVKEETIAV